MLFQTDHFIIREITYNDFNDILTFWSDKEVMKYIGDGTYGGGIEVVSKMIEKKITDYKFHPGLGFWALVDKNTGRVMGDCGLSPITGNEKEIEAGYIFHRNYWGKGYGTEILKALLDYGFKKLKLEQIIALAHPENYASIKIMQKCGMTFEKIDYYYNCYNVKYSIKASVYNEQILPLSKKDF